MIVIRSPTKIIVYDKLDLSFTFDLVYIVTYYFSYCLADCSQFRRQPSQNCIIVQYLVKLES